MQFSGGVGQSDGGPGLREAQRLIQDVSPNNAPRPLPGITTKGVIKREGLVGKAVSPARLGLSPHPARHWGVDEHISLLRECFVRAITREEGLVDILFCGSGVLRQRSDKTLARRSRV